MSAKEWGLVGLASILASPLLLGVSLVVVAVLFIVSIATLALLGLISAVILAAVGLGIVWLMGRVTSMAWVGRHWYLALGIVLGFFAVGWLSDHVAGFGLSLIPMVRQNFVLSQNALFGADATVSGAILISIISLFVAVLALMLSMKKTKMYLHKIKKML